MWRIAHRTIIIIIAKCPYKHLQLRHSPLIAMINLPHKAGEGSTMRRKKGLG